MFFYTFYVPFAAVFCILFFSTLERTIGKNVSRFEIPERRARRGNQREIFFSILNLLIFLGSGVLFDLILINKPSLFYHEIHSTIWEIIYLPASLLLCLLFHDVFFYFSHRLLHVPFFLKYIHRYHHKSLTVHPWATFCFHPLEGCIQISIVVWIPFILPLHPAIHLIFTFFMLFMSVYGHSGYEFRAKKAAFFNPFNTSYHHAQHHEFGTYNFGVYLNLWDRFFHTNHPMYYEGNAMMKKRIKHSKGAE